MAARKIFSFLKFLIPSVLLVTGLIFGLIYGGLFFLYQKISVSITDIEIKANRGSLEIGFKLSGNNPFPFALNLKACEGKVSHGVLSRNFAANFNPEILIAPGEYRLAYQSANLTLGYPVVAEDAFIKLLRGKSLQVLGEATIYVGTVKKSVPISVNLSIEE